MFPNSKRTMFSRPLPARQRDQQQEGDNANDEASSSSNLARASFNASDFDNPSSAEQQQKQREQQERTRRILRQQQLQQRAADDDGFTTLIDNHDNNVKNINDDGQVVLAAATQQPDQQLLPGGDDRSEDDLLKRLALSVPASASRRRQRDNQQHQHYTDNDHQNREAKRRVSSPQHHSSDKLTMMDDDDDDDDDSGGKRRLFDSSGSAIKLRQESQLQQNTNSRDTRMNSLLFPPNRRIATHKPVSRSINVPASFFLCPATQDALRCATWRQQSGIVRRPQHALCHDSNDNDKNVDDGKNRISDRPFEEFIARNVLSMLMSSSSCADAGHCKKQQVTPRVIIMVVGIFAYVSPSSLDSRREASALVTPPVLSGIVEDIARFCRPAVSKKSPHDALDHNRNTRIASSSSYVGGGGEPSVQQQQLLLPHDGARRVKFLTIDKAGSLLPQQRAKNFQDALMMYLVPSDDDNGEEDIGNSDDDDGDDNDHHDVRREQQKVPTTVVIVVADEDTLTPDTWNARFGPALIRVASDENQEKAGVLVSRLALVVQKSLRRGDFVCENDATSSITERLLSFGWPRQIAVRV